MSKSKLNQNSIQQQTLDAWRRVFGVTACVACGTYIVYQIFGTADIQHWNYPDQNFNRNVGDDAQPLNDSPTRKSKIIIKKSRNHSIGD